MRTPLGAPQPPGQCFKSHPPSCFHAPLCLQNVALSGARWAPARIASELESGSLLFCDVPSPFPHRLPFWRRSLLRKRGTHGPLVAVVVDFMVEKTPWRPSIRHQDTKPCSQQRGCCWKEGPVTHGPAGPRRPAPGPLTRLRSWGAHLTQHHFLLLRLKAEPHSPHILGPQEPTREQE